MPKLGKRGYKGPVHESVRKSPLGKLVQTKPKSKRKAHDVRSGVSQNKAQYKKDVAQARAEGWRKRSDGSWFKPRNVKAHDNAKKAAANARRMGPDTMREKAITSRPSKARGKPAKAAVSRAAAKVRSRNPGMSKSAARKKARQIVKAR